MHMCECRTRAACVCVKYMSVCVSVCAYVYVYMNEIMIARLPGLPFKTIPQLGLNNLSVVTLLKVIVRWHQHWSSASWKAKVQTITRPAYKWPPSVCLSICLSVCLSARLSVCLSVSACLCLSLSVSPGAIERWAKHKCLKQLPEALVLGLHLVLLCCCPLL